MVKCDCYLFISMILCLLGQFLQCNVDYCPLVLGESVVQVHVCGQVMFSYNNCIALRKRKDRPILFYLRMSTFRVLENVEMFGIPYSPEKYKVCCYLMQFLQLTFLVSLLLLCKVYVSESYGLFLCLLLINQSLNSFCCSEKSLNW